MRLHVLSDLHTERAPFEPPATGADVLVLAGDIGSGTAGIGLARCWAGGRPVLFLAGNHEFYGHSLPGLTGELRAAAAGSDVHVLEDDEIVIDGVRFLGCTLWSDFAAAGADELDGAMQLCGTLMNDYEQIGFDPERRALAPRDTLALHRASRRWLEERLAQAHPGPTVVITHHAPLIRRLPTLPHERALVGAFASDLTGLMGDGRVDLWIHGHTHRVAELDVHGTRVVSNPRGYPHQPVAGFDPARVERVGGT